MSDSGSISPSPQAQARITFAHTCEKCKKHTCDSRYIERWKDEWDEYLYVGGVIDLDGRAITMAIGRPCNCPRAPKEGDYVKGYEFAVLSTPAEQKKRMISFDSVCKNCTLPKRGRGFFIRHGFDMEKVIIDKYGLVNISQIEEIKDMISVKGISLGFIGDCKCTYDRWDPVFTLVILH